MLINVYTTKSVKEEQMDYRERYGIWMEKLPEDDPLRAELEALAGNEKEVFSLSSPELLFAEMIVPEMDLETFLSILKESVRSETCVRVWTCALIRSIISVSSAFWNAISICSSLVLMVDL